MSGFEELGLLPDLVRAVEDMEWYLPRPIQQEAIPLILGGGHVLCAAETGSGKTGAFCLPILQVTWEALNRTRKDGGAGGGASRCVINANDCNANAKISVDGTLCQCHDPRAWSGARCTFGVTKGKWYYEAIVVEDGGIVRFGLATVDGGLELGKDSFGFGYGGTGKKSFAGQFDDYGGPFGVGDRMGCAVDFAAGGVTFYKNGTCLGEAFKLPQALQGKPLHPAICIKNSLVQLVSSEKGVKYLPPGYKCFDAAAGPEQDAIAARLRDKQRSQGKVGPTCVVIEPTLELANQVHDEISKFTKYLSPPLKATRLIGKRDFKEMVTELKRGADIVIGTPGKLESFIDSGELNLDNIRFFVADEADRFATENFSFMTKLFKKMQTSNNGRTQVSFFSATLHSPEIKALAEEICPGASWVDLKGKEHIPETVHHAVVYVDPKETPWTSDAAYKDDQVHSGEKPVGDVYSSLGSKHMKPPVLLKIIEAYKMQQCIVFCRTRIDCDLLSNFLTAHGGRGKSGQKMEKGKENLYSNVVLHSGYSAKARDENLTMFKEGFARFLICTDVAARGIDITALPYVVNMMLPDKSEDYIHRVGRTGRSDRMGLAISIVSRRKEKVWYHTCPSRGENCSNRNIAEPISNGPAGAMRGGCCIWFDEAKCASAIEKRLKQPLDELDPVTFKFHAAGVDDGGYGKTRAEKDKQAKGLSAGRVASIQHLAALDKQSQGAFFDNKATMAALFQPL